MTDNKSYKVGYTTEVSNKELIKELESKCDFSSEETPTYASVIDWFAINHTIIITLVPYFTFGLPNKVGYSYSISTVSEVRYELRKIEWSEIGSFQCAFKNAVKRAIEIIESKNISKFKKDNVTIDDIEYVDLGLPSGTKWATCNIGASTPTEYGDYYMWGSTTPNTNDDCSWANAPFNNGSSDFDFAYFDEHKSEWFDNGNLRPEYDAVYQATGGQAHMPTKAQFDELRDNTTQTWIEDYEGTGVNGRLFTSKVNSSKSVFFPAAVHRRGFVVDSQYDYAGLWSCTIVSDFTYYAWGMDFDSDGCYVGPDYHCSGSCVRGVID